MYKPSDFSKMKYNVFADLTQALWVQYPIFQSRADLHRIPIGVFLDDEKVTDEDLDRLLRYVILYCSRHENPLARELDMQQRRDAIFSLLHIHRQDNLRMYVETWHKWVVTVMSVFLRLEDDSQYASWLSDKVRYYRSLEYQLMNPFDSDKPESVMAVQERIAKNKPQLEESLRKKEAMLFPDERMRSAITELEMQLLDGPGGFSEYVVAAQWPRFFDGDPSKMNLIS